MNQLARTEALQRHLKGETMTATIIDVAYVWNDQPEYIRHGRVAITSDAVTVDEFDRLMDDEDVFYVFEHGEPILGHKGEFKILTMEGVV